MQIINLIIKFPFRSRCKRKKKHILQQHSGYFGLMSPKYPWTCTVCGKRSKGDFDSLKKNGFLNKRK